MSLLLILSIILRGTALAWSVALAWRLRDARLGVLVALLVLLLLGLLLPAAEVASPHPLAGPGLGLLVSLAALLAVAVLSRILTAASTLPRTDAASLYQDLVEQINDVIFALDGQGRFTYISPVIGQQYGYTPPEVMGKPFTDFIHPDDQRGVLASYHATLSGRQEPYEFRVLTRQGATRHVRTHSRVVLDNNQPVGVRGVMTDITARKQAEHTQRRLSALLEATTDFVALADKTGRTVHLNRAGRRLMGFDEDEDLSAMTLSEYYPEAEALHILDEVLPVVQAEGVWIGETALLNREGNEIPVLQVMVGHQAPGRPVEFVSTIARDITAQKHAADEQERLIAELEARNAELERFTYTVSHDLKNPLITIKGFVGLLEKDAAQGRLDAMRADAAYINAAAEKMSRLLDALLVLSRLGRIVNPSENVSLTALAHNALTLHEDRITARGVEVVVDPAMPVVSGDRARLLQIYYNLIDNALKFMGDQPTPRIVLGARYDGDAWVYTVQDNGIGIAPQHHEQIFGLFDRLDAEGEGTGLGLALTRRIVEIHGGRIWVESEGAGQGSLFCFTLQPQAHPHRLLAHG